MESDPRIDAQRSSRGNITQKALKSRIEDDSCPPSEAEFLQEYVVLDKDTRSLKRELGSMKSTVEEEIIKEINSPDHEQRDFFQEISVLNHYLSLFRSTKQLSNRRSNKQRPINGESILKV